jgi:hypothetical protein
MLFQGNFWWGFPQDKQNNLYLLAWDNICQPKALGGLGIRSMEFLNNSLLARLGWKMVSNATLLWVDALRAKYLMNGASFLSAPNNPLSSWLWKGLLKNRGVVQQGACISIFSGLNVSIWDMPRVPLMLDFIPRPNPNLVDHPYFCVANLILPNVRVWNRLLLDDLFDS